MVIFGWHILWLAEEQLVAQPQGYGGMNQNPIASFGENVKNL